MTTKERIQTICEKIEAAQKRGVPVKVSAPVMEDLAALHGPGVLDELGAVVDQEIELYDLVKSGVPFEEALLKVGRVVPSDVQGLDL